MKRRMSALPLRSIRLTDPFWARWQRVLIEETLPTQYEQLEKSGRLANFRRAAKMEEGGHDGGYYFNDSDVYKWAEAVGFALGIAPGLGIDGSALKKLLDEATRLIKAAQEPGGYVNTFFQLKFPNLKWRNLGAMHEMYTGGHLIEAGVAVFEATGDRALLDIAQNFADHVLSIFGPEDGSGTKVGPKWTGTRVGYCGHEEIELAMVSLARATHDKTYREWARWTIEERGKRPSIFEAELDDAEAVALCPGMVNQVKKGGVYNGEYFQDHAPIREHDSVVGHAVRAMYLYIAATDLADGQEDAPLEEALTKAWNSLTRKRMYVTGGIGPSGDNEGFTNDFDLPNATAYAETCAACGLVFWGRRLLELTGDSEYADILERSLYNGALSGISLDGKNYFYDNPLESRGKNERVPWFGCACCPPNIARLIGSLGQYVVGAGDKSFYIHLPVAFEAEAVFNGVKVKLSLEGTYPWSGKVTLKVDPAKPVQFALHVRIPDWADEISTDIPGSEDGAEYDQGYAVFDRTWSPGDKLVVDFEMGPKWVEADPKVRDNIGRVALTYGPLVYCAEEKDLGYAPQLFSADLETPVEVQWTKELGGINRLEVAGIAEKEEFVDGLYAEAGTTPVIESVAKFIPYFAWNNRGKNNMQVWVRHL